MEKPSYRPDVDGLRAVAVLSVIFYHAGFERFFGGGYVGVDVFFVISGYIIARMIASQLASGTWSFADFYERRFRRILPPLFCMLALCLVPAWLIFYDPEQIWSFFRIFKRAALGLSNFALYDETNNYFAAPEQSLPLLHTWSLAVEEQFYLFLPIALWLLWTFKREKLIPGILGITLLSLLLSAVMARVDAKFDFYMLPTRAYELLLGVLLALEEKRRPCKAPALTHLIGLAIVVLSVLLFGLVPKDAFPGLWALLPCLGTALCIWSGSGAGSGAGSASHDDRHDRAENVPLSVRLLGSRPMRGIGLISYGLYLYHWPVLVFLREARFEGGLPPLSQRLLALAGVFALAVLSYFLLEQPIRRKRIFVSRRKAFAASLVGVAAFVLIGQGGRRLDAPYVPPEAAGYLLTELYWDFVNGHTTKNEDGIALCPLGDPQQPPSFLVLGDSHAIMLAKAIHEVASEHGRRGEMYAKYAHERPPALPTLDEPCRKLVEKRSHVSCLLVFRWSFWLGGKNLEDFSEALRQSIDFLLERGVEKIFLMMPFPSQKIYAPPARAVMLVKHGQRAEDVLFITAEENRLYNHAATTVLTEVAARYPQVRLLDPEPLFCSGGAEGQCPAIRNGRVLFRDDNHLSNWGADLVKPLIAEIFADAGRQARPE